MDKCGLHSPSQGTTALGFEEGFTGSFRKQFTAGLEVFGGAVEHCCSATIESLGPLQGVGGHVYVELEGIDRADTPCKAGFYFSRFRRLDEYTQVGGGRSFIHRGFALQRSGGVNKGAGYRIGIKGQVAIDPK